MKKKIEKALEANNETKNAAQKEQPVKNPRKHTTAVR